MEEMIAFERMAESITEYSDSLIDDDNNAVRDKKGRLITLEDMCDIKEYTNPSGGDPIFKVSMLRRAAQKLTRLVFISVRVLPVARRLRLQAD